MSEMGDVYRALRENDQMERGNRLQEAERIVGHLFTKLSSNHWRTKVGRHTLDYWPSTGTYRWHNRNGRAARRGRSDQIEPDRMLELLTEALKNGKP